MLRDRRVVKRGVEIVGIREKVEEGKRREDPFAAGDRFLSGVSWTSRGGRLCAVKDCGPPLLLQRNIIIFVFRTHQKQT